MTSSDATPVAGAAARDLVAGHLHPGMLFLRFLDAVRGSIVLALIALVSQSLWLGGLVVMMFVLTLTYALARFLTFRYRLTADELITSEGILHRQERRIPINRIQDLSFEQSILRRMLGLVVVSVETASGQGTEARLDSLGRREAGLLREALLQQRALLTGVTVAATAPSEYVLYRAGVGELVLRGLTNNRLGVILATLIGVWELLREVGLDQSLIGATVERLAGLGPIPMVLALLALLVGALLAGWLVSVLTSILLYFRFTLTQRDDVFQRRYGLITTHIRSLPRRKVQRVLVEQSLLRRLLNLATVRADSAGSAGDQTQERSAGGPNVVVPLTRPAVIAPLLPLLLPGLEREQPVFQRAPRAVLVRTTIAGVLQAALFGGLGWIWFGPWALVALMAIPLGWVQGVLLLRNLAFALGEEHVVLRWGMVGRYQAFVPLRKVQGVTVDAGPIERLLGLGRLTLWVAGGSPSTMHDMPLAYVRGVKEQIARRAARWKFVW